MKTLSYFVSDVSILHDKSVLIKEEMLKIIPESIPNEALNVNIDKFKCFFEPDAFISLKKIFEAKFKLIEPRITRKKNNFFLIFRIN